MKAKRFCIEILTLGTAVACTLALGIAALGAAAGADFQENAQENVQQHALKTAPTPSPQTAPETGQTYKGMVTDTHCGARHQAAIDKTAADCTRACVRTGAQFALVDGDKTYILSGDLDQLKQVAGLRSRIVGTLNGDTIAVSSVTPGS